MVESWRADCWADSWARRWAGRRTELGRLPRNQPGKPWANCWAESLPGRRAASQAKLRVQHVERLEPCARHAVGQVAKQTAGQIKTKKDEQPTGESSERVTEGVAVRAVQQADRWRLLGRPLAGCESERTVRLQS